MIKNVRLDALKAEKNSFSAQRKRRSKKSFGLEVAKLAGVLIVWSNTHNPSYNKQMK